jgi:FkbM family methyltransferase
MTFIFYAERFVSVADPYVLDNFVSTHHRPIKDAAEAATLVNVYREVSASNKLLSGLLKEILRINESTITSVIDIGVFMGSFTIGIALLSSQAGIQVKIDAYEANPLLISSIVKNLQIYNVEANLHWSAIGRQRGSQELVVNDGGAIGGSLSNILGRKHGDYFSCNVDVLPLSDVLKDSAELELVKIDIEGYEVQAFSSIYGSDNKLNNIFIVEYAPPQGRQQVAEGVSYDEFILAHFDVFNLGNWGWFRGAQPIHNQEELSNCDLGNGGKNTDLLFLPKRASIDILNLLRNSV